MKRGEESFSALFHVILLLLLFGGVVLVLLVSLRHQVTDLSDESSQVCSSFQAGTDGRCFSTDNCDGQPGWTKITGAGCPEKEPVCCYLDDPTEYYPEGTVLITVGGLKPRGTFRVPPNNAKDTTLKLETGVNAGSKSPVIYLKTGIPRDKQFTISFRPPKKEYKYPTECTLTIDKKSPSDFTLKPCEPGDDGFVAFPIKTLDELLINTCRKTTEKEYCEISASIKYTYADNTKKMVKTQPIPFSTEKEK